MNTLTFAQRLREAGLADRHAEAIAQNVHEYVMNSAATKSDLNDLENRLRLEIRAVDTSIAALKSDLAGQSNAITVRLGAVVAAGIAVLAALNYFS